MAFGRRALRTPEFDTGVLTQEKDLARPGPILVYDFAMSKWRSD
jgi:hypothetical protein